MGRCTHVHCLTDKRYLFKQTVIIRHCWFQKEFLFLSLLLLNSCCLYSLLVQVTGFDIQSVSILKDFYQFSINFSNWILSYSIISLFLRDIFLFNICRFDNLFYVFSNFDFLLHNMCFLSIFIIFVFCRPTLWMCRWCND